MASFARAELRGLGARVLHQSDSELIFEYAGNVRELFELRRCVAVYFLLHYDVPRPKALLGHAQLTLLTKAISQVRSHAPDGAFTGFRFGAAGSGSPVFLRLASALSSATSLPHNDDQGELLLRFRPGARGGWEVLIRMTPRPLSARYWRTCNRPGGLNATVAAASHDLLGVGTNDHYLNLMCGSGTLLIERALAGRWRSGTGVDSDGAALSCSRENAERAGLVDRIDLLHCDATDTPFAPGAFNRLTADLPWGDAVGGHLENELLYPRFLAESARVAAPRARMVVITHELRLFREALLRQTAWRNERLMRVFHSGHRPGLYLLARAA